MMYASHDPNSILHLGKRMSFHTQHTSIHKCIHTHLYIHVYVRSRTYKHEHTHIYVNA